MHFLQPVTFLRYGPDSAHVWNYVPHCLDKSNLSHCKGCEGVYEAVKSVYFMDLSLGCKIVVSSYL